MRIDILFLHVFLHPYTSLSLYSIHILNNALFLFFFAVSLSLSQKSVTIYLYKIVLDYVALCTHTE